MLMVIDGTHTIHDWWKEKPEQLEINGMSRKFVQEPKDSNDRAEGGKTRVDIDRCERDYIGERTAYVNARLMP